MFRVSRGFLFCLLLAAMPGLCRSPAWRNRCCSTCRCKASGRRFAAHRITDITINYHRPLVNERKVWAVWFPMARCGGGANLNTTITFSDPVTIEGKALDKGRTGCT